MNTENPPIYDSTQSQIIEHFAAPSPDVAAAVLPLTLIVEAIDLGNLARLVVAAEDADAVAVPELERDEQGDGLDRVVAAVDVVAHEEVVGVGRVAADAEEL